MTNIRSALTKSQKNSVLSVEGSTALVMSLNREIGQKTQEIEAQKKTIKDTQDELENWREKYHDADKQNVILSSKVSFVTGVEFLKYIVSAIGTSYGVNLLSSNDSNGWTWIIGSVVVYALITVWEKKN